MPYTKRPAAIAINEALAQTLLEHGLGGEGGVAEAVFAAVLAAGAAVDLDDGTPVWLSCIHHDRPETPQVDFLTVAIACTPEGVPWVKGNGQHVAVVFWHGMFPDVLAALSVDVARRALLMVALGEPQPQVPITPPAEGGPLERDALQISDCAARSIRSAITAANEIAAPLGDVL